MSGRGAGATCGRDPVPLTAREVSRVARALELPPDAFCDKVPAPPEAPGAFALDDAGPRWILAMGRRDDGACAFLLRLPSGEARCGLGALAPAACGLGAAPTATPGDADHHRDVVTAWNALVARRGGRYLLETFADHLLSACAPDPAP